MTWKWPKRSGCNSTHQNFFEGDSSIGFSDGIKASLVTRAELSNIYIYVKEDLHYNVPCVNDLCQLIKKLWFLLVQPSFLRYISRFWFHSENCQYPLHHNYILLTKSYKYAYTFASIEITSLVSKWLLTWFIKSSSSWVVCTQIGHGYKSDSLSQCIKSEWDKIATLSANL